MSNNATMIYSYNAEYKKLYIHYPHFTDAVPVEDGIDGKYVVFEDEIALNEFMGYLDEHNLDTSELNACSFGETWDSNALSLKELL